MLEWLRRTWARWRYQVFSLINWFSTWPRVLGGVGSTRTRRTEGLRGSCRNTRAEGNMGASLEVWDLPIPEWALWEFCNRAPTWHHLLTTLFNIFPSVKSEEAEVWHLQPKILKFHGYWVYPEKSNPGNSEPWQSKLKDNKEPQLCPTTMPEQNQREHKDKSSSSQNWLSQAKPRLFFTLSAWISLNYSLNS